MNLKTAIGNFSDFSAGLNGLTRILVAVLITLLSFVFVLGFFYIIGYGVGCLIVIMSGVKIILGISTPIFFGILFVIIGILKS